MKEIQTSQRGWQKAFSEAINQQVPVLIVTEDKKYADILVEGGVWERLLHTLKGDPATVSVVGIIAAAGIAQLVTAIPKKKTSTSVGGGLIYKSESEEIDPKATKPLMAAIGLIAAVTGLHYLKVLSEALIQNKYDFKYKMESKYGVFEIEGKPKVSETLG
ncbi:MAG TPA: hypothetical protein PKH33_18325 [bacterium]|nr:hypothetical protein [bacterium]